MGALAIANGAEQNPTWFKAVIPLDMGISNPAFVSLGVPLVTNPVFYQFSNAIYSEIESLDIVIPLAENTSYSLLISPSIESNFYSAHGNFTDFSTLQYMPIYQQTIDYVGGAWSFGLGLGNGIDITNAININVVQFLNTYLKNQPNNVFNTDNCSPLSANTLLQCGPGTI